MAFCQRAVNSLSIHGAGGGYETAAFSYDASQCHTYAVDWLPDRLVFYLGSSLAIQAA